MARRLRVGWVPYGLNEQHPNHFREIAQAIRANSLRLPYAWRILRDGCCDGCALGTRGLRDWTMRGVHLCTIRLQLLQLNTMRAMDAAHLQDVAALRVRLAAASGPAPAARRGVGRGRPRRGVESALRNLGRLPAPMVRRRGEPGFRPVGWDEAIGLVAERLRQIPPQRIAWYLTSRGLTNESYYAHQKVARFLGTNHIDTSARICHAPSTSALKATIGVAASTCSYADWIGSDLVIFVGSNVANNQPVSMKYLYYAKQAGTKVFIVNPYREPGMERYWIPSVAASALFGTRIADDSFLIHAGGDIPFFYGVLKHCVANNWLDRTFMANRTSGWGELEATLRALEWTELERGAGQTRADMHRFAQALARARHAIVVWSMGITHHRHGSDNVRMLVNLQLARGNLGRPHAGLMPIRGHSGVQGGAEMGAQPGAYIMGAPVGPAAARTLAAPAQWGFEPPVWPGMGAAEMILAAERGEIEALWQSGGNFLDTLPDPERVRRALQRIPLRVHQDIVGNPSMLVEPGELAVLLPSRTRYEQRGGGCETSTERRVIFSPEIEGHEAPAGSRDEWEIPVLLARHWDGERARAAFPWRDTMDIRAEIERVCPAYQGIGQLRAKGDQFQYGGASLLADSFPTPDGKGHFSVVPLPASRAAAAPDRFLLTTRRGRQFNSMIWGETDPLNGARRHDILISAEDAARLRIAGGDAICLRGEAGRYYGRARIDRIAPGNLQGHWPEVNALIPADCLDSSGVPDYTAWVAVERAAPAGA